MSASPATAAEIEHRRLSRLRLLNVLDTRPEPVFDALVRIAAAVCGAPIALVSLIDVDRQWFKANLGLEGTPETPRAVAFCDHTIRGDEVMEIGDATRDDRFSVNPLVTGEPNIRFYAGAPIVMPSGERIGSLCVIDRKPRELSAQQRQALTDLAVVVEWALTQRARIHDLTVVGDESRFQAISYASPMGIFQTDASGALYYANGRWQELLGITLDRGMGMGWLDAVHPQERDAVRLAWADAVTARQAFDMELRVPLSGGADRWLRIQARPGQWGEPPQEGWVGVAGDITARKQAQHQQKDAFDLLETVLENIPCGVSVFDAGLRLIAHNRQFPELLDFPDSLFASRTPQFEDFIRHNAQRGEYGPGDIGTIVSGIVAQAREPARHHMQRTRPGGVTLDIRGAPMPGGGFVTTYVDISPAKAAERALRESEERQARALDASRLALWDLEVASGNLYLSANWSEMLGTAKESMVTTLQALMDRVPGDEQELVALAFGAVLKGTQGSYSVEHRVRRDDGTLFWIHSQGKVTQRDAQGRALQMTGTNQDISARKAIAAELEQARLAAEEANRAKTDFLHNVSHEIRTPLNGVLGMTRMLLSEDLTPRQRQYAELANTSASSLLGLINDLLDLGKIEAGRLELENIAFDLHALLQDIAQLYRLSARAKGLDFSLGIAREIPVQVTGDPGRLRQILNNLLSNALKFTASGGITLGVAPASGTMLRFTVSDTGVGISHAVQHKLFDRFTQADSSTTRKYGGTGLGLAIVKRLCEQMGGGVRLESVEGRGSTFTCDIPLSPAAAAQTLPAAVRGAASEPVHAMRILLAEDNPTNQLVAQGLLALAGYHDVTTVEDGEQAVAAVERGGIDIVLMDCRMPRLDGYEATLRLRAAGYTLPIVALTANATHEERERCLAHGMNDFLSKPIDENSLADTIARWTSGVSRAAPAASPGAVVAAKHAFSRAAALEQLSGDEELLAVVLASFRQHGPALLDRAREALAANDVKALHRHLHSLKGSAGTLGAVALATLAKDLEMLAADGRAQDVRTRLGELEGLLAGFLAAADSW